MYTAIKSWDNGRREEQQFEDYIEMCQWLAGDDEAGIIAYDDGEAIDQSQLQDDVESYQ